jgi:CubicO group peptidase (beta-lactamase class C family)
MATALIEALADGEPARLNAFVTARFSKAALAEYPASAWARSLVIAAQESGGLSDWHLDGDAGDVRVSGHTRATGLPVAGHVWLDLKDNGRIRGLQLTRDLSARTANAPVWPKRVIEGREITAAIDREIDWRASNNRFSGVVLVAHGDEILVERAVGWADAGHRRENRASDRFALASLGKMFTAVAVAQLVEAGKLLLDEPIGRLLPTYPDRHLAQSITPRQLLGHTSGLGELRLTAPDVWQDFERGAEPSEMLHHLAEVTQEFPPGTGYSYSNAGFLVLGALIEAAGGTSYVDRIRTRVFEPAGMADALFPEPGRLPDRAAEGLTFAPDDPFGLRARIGNGTSVPIFSGPASGAYATANDLFRFMRALSSGRLIASDTLRTFTNGLSPTWDKLGLYALGFIERRTSTGRMFGHAGGAGAAGINDIVWSSADGAWTVVVLSNYDAPVAVDLGTGIMDFVMGSE